MRQTVYVGLRRDGRRRSIAATIRPRSQPFAASLRIAKRRSETSARRNQQKPTGGNYAALHGVQSSKPAKKMSSLPGVATAKNPAFNVKSPPVENPATGSAITAFMWKHELCDCLEFPAAMTCASMEKVGLSATHVTTTAPSSAARSARRCKMSPVDLIETRLPRFGRQLYLRYAAIRYS